ncbi:DUF4286 family protein [Pedobacter sp. SD-b]|uniref:DUF4286 family protein n=1 Tax=Pedobacter segetis TaxID=2793069 RepID=A0ABS1BJV9_9SPHI|nr:DUF4286 family protein [Pedobacter segetis]MBK0383180.1 DUF4286 family protein [Pedobacter segetis]
MIIYNVTSIVEENIKDDFLAYMQEIHIPEVMATGKFTTSNLYRLTEPVNEGTTFCAQYIAEDPEDLKDYRENYAPKLQQDVQQKFGDQVVSFRSVLEKI